MYPYPLPVGRGFGLGLAPLHRGKYVEDPAWKPAPGMVYLGSETVEWTFTLTPDDGLLTIPALMRPEPDETAIRDIVRDELASTPVYTALRYEDYGRTGQWGDVTIDLADEAPVCTTVEVECPEHWDEELWWLRGA